MRHDFVIDTFKRKQRVPVVPRCRICFKYNGAFFENLLWISLAVLPSFYNFVSSCVIIQLVFYLKKYEFSCVHFRNVLQIKVDNFHRSTAGVDFPLNE